MFSRRTTALLIPEDCDAVTAFIDVMGELVEYIIEEELAWPDWLDANTKSIHLRNSKLWTLIADHK